ncbi:hypothetical protein DSO57_1023479 [Entomophthora muscae]|uniref:Uncharacterized protein n=1 Tax=Entomophthora muscae TaxID=34485 RepID=A0ACC2SFE6_9FUNG|nr:hypothetical protein DSO57_1023479 [Entomophthora muscae]
MSQEINTIFQQFRDNLDKHHDRREKIIITSRDITAKSKKVIFGLHRLSKNSNADLFKKSEDAIKVIIDSFKSISAELQGANFYRYYRQISPGIQEFIEAISFKHFSPNQYTDFYILDSRNVKFLHSPFFLSL